MEILFYVSLVFLSIYLFILLKPRELETVEQYGTGCFYYIFCVLFLIVIYLYKHSILIVLIAIPILFFAQYPIQIIAGAIVRTILKRKC